MKRKIFILLCLLATGAIGYTPPPDKLPPLIGPPVVDARTTVVVVGGGVAAPAEDWTPSYIEFYEGGDSVMAGNYRLAIYDDDYDLVFYTVSRGYAGADAYVTINATGTPADIAPSTGHYLIILTESNYMSYKNKSGASTWSAGDGAGTYASPASSAAECVGNYSFKGSPLLRVKNAAGQILLQWSGEAGDSLPHNVSSLMLCIGATSEETPQ